MTMNTDLVEPSGDGVQLLTLKSLAYYSTTTLFGSQPEGAG